jgi:hypothetical protein
MRTNEILKLPSSLLNNSILTLEDDAHPGEISNLGSADDQGVCQGAARNVELSELRRDYEEEESGLTDVKASGGQDTRNSRKDSRLVLNETVQDVSDKGKQDRLDELKSALQGDYFK